MIEKAIVQRLRRFLGLNLHYDNQFGIRNNMATEKAILQFKVKFTIIWIGNIMWKDYS